MTRENDLCDRCEEKLDGNWQACKSCKNILCWECTSGGICIDCVDQGRLEDIAGFRFPGATDLFENELMKVRLKQMEFERDLRYKRQLREGKINYF